MPDGESPETVKEDPTTETLNEAEKAWAVRTHRESGSEEEKDTLLEKVDKGVANTLLSIANEIVEPAREAA